jgi:hypothetical protein
MLVPWLAHHTNFNPGVCRKVLILFSIGDIEGI